MCWLFAVALANASRAIGLGCRSRLSEQAGLRGEIRATTSDHCSLGVEALCREFKRSFITIVNLSDQTFALEILCQAIDRILGNCSASRRSTNPGWPMVSQIRQHFANTIRPHGQRNGSSLGGVRPVLRMAGSGFGQSIMRPSRGSPVCRTRPWSASHESWFRTSGRDTLRRKATEGPVVSSVSPKEERTRSPKWDSSTEGSSCRARINVTRLGSPTRRSPSANSFTTSW